MISSYPRGVLRISSDRDDKTIFSALKFSILEIWGGKFGKYFLGWLDLSIIFLLFNQKQSQDLR